jgi:hypothetical protein
MKRVSTVLAVLLAAILPGSVLAQKGHGPSNGGRNSSQGSMLIGTVSSLQATATGSSFVLQDGRNTLTVLTTSATTITNASDGSTATLADGLKVGVKGTYDTAAQTLTATSVVVNNRFIGTVSNVQITDAGYTFDLTTGKSQVIAVTATAAVPVKKASDGSTTAVAEGLQVQVTGIYDATASTLTPTAIVVNDVKPAAHRFGVVANLQTTATGFTFDLTDKKGATLAVATMVTTKILLFSDNSTTTLANGQNVCVSGAYDTTTKVLTATSVIVNDKATPSACLYVAGTVASIDTTAGALVLTLQSSNVQPTGTTVTVKVTSSTVYKAGKGSKASLSAITVGAGIKAKGTFDATAQTLTATEVTLGK